MKPLACLVLMLAALAAPVAAQSATAPTQTMPAPAPAAQAMAVNLDHFDHLYADVEIGGVEMGVVRIYAQYPGYRYAIEPNEGFACVDDAARALVLLVREWPRQRDPGMLDKIRRLTRFLLHMQSGNGYFNNFLWGDLRTNVDYRTSLAELNWWSLRALWGLEEALTVLQDDATLAEPIRQATARVVRNLVRDLPTRPRRMVDAAGLGLPNWLPNGSAADQAAVALIALLPHWKRTGDAAVQRLMEAQADGILRMQHGDAVTYPHGMFLSWRNVWHAWGNAQAYALLSVGEALGRPAYIQAALKEVDHFYPYLLKQGFAEAIEVGAADGKLHEVRRTRFPQIAYGLRPMVFAAVKAHAVTGKPHYRRLAAELGAWLTGRNDAAMPVYDPATGIAFDGIVGLGRVNRNSGAESTVEALLLLQALRDVH
jgi:predicted RecB family endonuclease